MTADQVTLWVCGGLLVVLTGRALLDGALLRRRHRRNAQAGTRRHDDAEAPQ